MKSEALHILLVEDDKYFRIGIKDVLMKHGVVHEVDTQELALAALAAQKFDLAIVDIHLGEDPLGLNILSETKKRSIPSIVLSSSDDDEITEKAYELGCHHFLVKKHFRKYLDDFVSQIKNSLGKDHLKDFFEHDFITQDQEIIGQIQQLSQMSLKGHSIFIGGETGVGKSLIGKLAHSLCFSPQAPFVHINCSEIPENLLESELFGAKKGSYTGADKDREGYLKQADGGILFLDEIATMPMSMQQKLLKALDEKTFYPVGSSKVERSDFTLISATCEDLFLKVHNKQFRKDLFFRISGINLYLKPLRERQKDIELLIKKTLRNSPRRIVLKPDALSALLNYPWPGNARELLKACEILSMKAKGVIDVDDLPDFISSGLMGSESTFSDNLGDDLSEDTSEDHSVSESKSPLSEYQRSFIAENGLKEYVKTLELHVVKETLKNNNGKIAKTIKDLKISSSAFYRIYEKIK